MLIMTRESLKKCIINLHNQLRAPPSQWRWPQIDLNASVTEQLSPWDKENGGERATLILMKKCSSPPPFPMLLKKMIAQTQRSPKS